MASASAAHVPSTVEMIAAPTAAWSDVTTDRWIVTLFNIDSYPP